MAKKTFLNLPEERKDVLLTACEDIFYHTKYEDIVIADLIKAMNIPVGSFYRYFEDKDDLAVTFFIYEGKKKSFDMELRHIMEPEEPTEEEVEVVSVLNEALSKIPFYLYQRVIDEGYYEESFLSYKKYLTMLKYDNKLRSDLDVDMIAFMYVRTLSDLELYFQKFEITDQKLRWQMKKYFYYTFFKYGIMGKEDEE